MGWGKAVRVGVLGFGAIGSVVAEQLAAGQVAGATLEGVILRRQRSDVPYEHFDLQEALKCCNLIVECAGQQAVREHAAAILNAGVDLLICSVGALADQELAMQLEAAGPGRLLTTAGAVGGLDLLAAGARMGSFEEVVFTTRKLPRTLIQPWMSDVQCESLETATEMIEVFTGTAAEAAQKFPKSLNVVAAVALAVGNWDVVSVRLLADPQAHLTEHLIQARGASGEYSLSFKNYPSVKNPRTSGIVPYGLLHSLQQVIGTRRI